MRVLTFSVLRNCKFKPWCFQIGRNVSDTVLEKTLEKADAPIKTLEELELEPTEVMPSWPSDTERELKVAALASMQVFPNFISTEEEQSLMIEVEPVLKRMRYEYDHWDNAIEGYRETERSLWNDFNEQIIARMKAQARPPLGTKWLKHVHVLDIAPTGYIRPHIDAVRFCGDIIVGLCLLSTAVMRLKHAHKPALSFNTLLPQRGLYIMSGVSRYEFQHEVLPRHESEFRGVPVPRQRRVSLICRTEPLKENTL